jgi:glutamyl-tRNA reductase
MPKKQEKRLDKFRQILDAKVKPKEKISLLAQTLAADKKLIDQLVVFFEKANDSEKGTCLAALADITKNDPKYIEPCLGFVTPVNR